METREDTELVDISDVAAEEQLAEAAAGEEDEQYLPARQAIASLRERFAAFFVDTLVLFYLYWPLGSVARRAFYGSWDGPIPCYDWQGAVFHGAFFFIAFLYYFIFEGVFFTTPGKFLCWMYVRQKSGRYTTMSAVFVRNIFRLFDYMIPIVPIFCMELTRSHQRLGDIIAGTSVIKKYGGIGVPYDVNMSNIASASGRALSFTMDIIFVAALTAGYILLFSSDSPVTSKYLLLFSPLVPMLYFIISEPLTQTTPGKWLFGYTITHEDGTPVSFVSSLIRTFMRWFDTNPIGLLAMWISHKHQRFGDLAADTVVSRQKRKWHGAAALGFWLFASSGVLWFGLQNKNNILNSEFRFNFLPALEVMGNAAIESAYKAPTITHIRFAAGNANTIRTPAVFKAGEMVYVISDFYGYERHGRMVWVQEDIEVKYPNSSIGVHQENAIDFHQVTQTSGPIELTNNIKLPADAMPGAYTVTITVRDLFAHENAIEKETFEVRGEGDSPPSERGLSPSIPSPLVEEGKGEGATSPSLNAPPPGTTLPPETEQPAPPPPIKSIPAPNF